MNFPLFFLIFVTVAAAFLGSAWAVNTYLLKSRKNQLRERLGPFSEDAPEPLQVVTILSEERGASLLVRFRSWALSQVEFAGLKWKPGKVLILCGSCAVAGSLFGIRISRALPHGAAPFVFFVPILCAGLPFLFLARMRRKRLNQFEAQLPDALDFLARSLRVGNSFLMSLEMLVDESEEPLSGEFRRLTGEIRLGSPMSEPMQRLMQRVPLIDLRMFVSAVLLQRETGGNLGALLTRIAASIRDRFRVRGQVGAASSQAKLSARVLTVMPFAVLGGILVLSPDYLKVMTNEPLGRKLLVIAACGQFIGYFIMRKIVRIKV